jgi:N-acetylmuramoyl-L-alanine amidase
VEKSNIRDKAMKRFLLLAAVLVFLLACSSCDSIAFLANAGKQSAGAGSGSQLKSISDIRIAVDPGHGGIDKGTAGTDTGVLESDLNLALSKILTGKFKDAGADTAMTRQSADVDYSGEGDTQKLKDMNNRVKLVNAQNPHALVSVHMNTFSDRSVSGAQVFYQKDNAQGEELARCIQDELNAGVNGNNKRHTGSGEYYLLKGVECPSVIVECGFLSNKDDEKNLQDPEYQKKLVDCIYKGVCDYLGLK